MCIRTINKLCRGALNYFSFRIALFIGGLGSDGNSEADSGLLYLFISIFRSLLFKENDRLGGDVASQVVFGEEKGCS